MEKKQNTSFINSIIFIAMIIGVTMVIIPLPSIVLEVLVGIEVLFSVVIFISSLKKKCIVMPNLLIIFSLFSIVLNISVIRISLVGYETGINVSLVEKISNVIGGKNYIISGIIIVSLLTIQVLLISKVFWNISEVNAEFIVGVETQRFREISYEFTQGLIDKTKEIALKEILRKEANYYWNMEVASKFLNGISKANVFLTFINLSCVITIEIFNLKNSIVIALENAILKTNGNVVLFTIPIMVVSFAARLAIIDDLKKFRTETEKTQAESPKEIIEIDNDDFIIEMSYTLIPLVDSENESPLVSKILELRKKIPNLPKIRIVDNMELKENEYYIHWKEIEVKKIIAPVKSADEKAMQIMNDIADVYKLVTKDKN